MLTAVATHTGHSVEVQFIGAAADTEPEAEVEPKDGPSPIVPEVKELAWSFGAFVVFAVLMRLVLYPRLKKGMVARYADIRGGHEGAEAARAAARAEVAEYEAQLATVKAEANERVDAARRSLEALRETRLAEANARIAERRSAARSEADAAREAVRGDLESAAGEVASRLVELSTGRRPEASVISSAVDASMHQGATR